MFARLRVQTDEYVKGKTWYWYVPLWLFGIYIFIALLGFHPNEQQAFIVSVAHSFDFMLHEMAHILTGFLPELMTAAAGSFSELLLGVLLVYGAFKSRSYFASLFCFLWLMLACQSAGVYMADARAQEMDLVSLGAAASGSSNVIHDWNFIFGELNMLGMDTLIGGTVQAIGVMAGLFGLGFAAWMIYKMAAAAKTNALNRKEAELLHTTASEAGLHAAPPKHFQGVKEGSIYPTPHRGGLADRPASNSRAKDTGKSQSG